MSRPAGQRLRVAFGGSVRALVAVLPVLVGMMLLTSLMVTLFPEQLSSGIFGRGQLLDSLLAAGVGSVAAGHPLASYLLGGELLRGGVSLMAVTALLVSWVTVGMVQLPAEALLLGGRFAVYRNAVSFASALAVAWLSVGTLQLLGLA